MIPEPIQSSSWQKWRNQGPGRSNDVAELGRPGEDSAWQPCPTVHVAEAGGGTSKARPPRIKCRRYHSWALANMPACGGRAELTWGEVGSVTGMGVRLLSGAICSNKHRSFIIPRPLFSPTCPGWVSSETEQGRGRVERGKCRDTFPAHAHCTQSHSFTIINQVPPRTPTHLPSPLTTLHPVLKSVAARLSCVGIQGQPPLTVI